MPEALKSLLKRMLRILLLGALFVAMAGAGAYVTLTWVIQSDEPVIVPDLVNKDVLFGLEILSDLGLNTRVRETRYHDQVPRNHIIDQHPEPGTAIKRGRDVKIRVSRGPESIIMPNLHGLQRQQSRILLSENGLCPGVITGMSSSLNPTGQVIAQHPPPGTTITRSACVDLLISRGPRLPAVAMSDLAGLPLETAIRRVDQLQLTVGHIRPVQHRDAPPETIVGQTPLAGYRVSPGHRVDLMVNRTASEGRLGGSAEPYPAELFRYALEEGFLNRRVQVKLNLPQASLQLFDGFLRPGQELWLLIPKNDNPTVLVYLDEQLVDTRIMGSP